MDLYRASIEHAVACLHSLTSLLKKASESPVADVILESRLHDEMLPLSFQVHVVTDLCNKAAHRLTGKEPVTLSYDIKSIQDCHSRIEQVERYLRVATQKLVEDSRSEVIHVGVVGPGLPPIDLKRHDYAFHYLLPNITFHLVVAYSIMRKEGVPLGKMDYLDAFVGQHLPLLND